MQDLQSTDEEINEQALSYDPFKCVCVFVCTCVCVCVHACVRVLATYREPKHSTNEVRTFWLLMTTFKGLFEDEDLKG